MSRGGYWARCCGDEGAPLGDVGMSPYMLGGVRCSHIRSIHLDTIILSGKEETDEVGMGKDGGVAVPENCE